MHHLHVAFLSCRLLLDDGWARQAAEVGGLPCLASDMPNMVTQAVTKDALAMVDGSPQSMLAVVGETHVAGLAEASKQTFRWRLCAASLDGCRGHAAQQQHFTSHMI